MRILRDIQELLNAGIVTEDTAARIRNYYSKRNSSPTNRLYTVFGILGAILVGLGMIQIVAHNWDELSKAAKTFFGFLPLLIGQALCALIMVKKRDSIAWRESGASFLFFAIGANIALISQIYHIPGDVGSFLSTWMLLCLPLFYLMRSSVTSLLYLVGITCYATYLGYLDHFPYVPSFYWVLFSGILPYYYLLYREKPESNFMVFHNWLIPLSVVVTLGTIAKNAGEFMFIAYFSLFGLFYMTGNSVFFSRQKTENNGYKLIGWLGTMTLLLMLSFEWFWKNLEKKVFPFSELIVAPEFLVSGFLFLLATGFLYRQIKSRPPGGIRPLATVFILFTGTFMLGLFSKSFAVVLINLYVFAIGILTMRDGARNDHLGTLNIGLLVVTVLVGCRFFDTNLSFIVRGILFVSVGTGFFVANYWMLKKRKTNEQ